MSSLESLEVKVDQMIHTQTEHAQHLADLHEMMGKLLVIEDRQLNANEALGRAFEAIDRHSKRIDELEDDRTFVRGGLWVAAIFFASVVVIMGWALKAQIDIAQQLPIWKYSVDQRITNIEQREQARWKDKP